MNQDDLRSKAVFGTIKMAWTEFAAFVKENWKMLLLAILINAILTLGVQWFIGFQSDYTHYYLSARDSIFTGFTRTYDETYWNLISSMGPYRYLPAFLYVLFPLTLLPLAWSYVAFYSINMFVSIICYFYLKKICTLMNIQLASSPGYEILMQCIFLILLTWETLIIGQLVLLLGLCLILAFHNFLNGHEFRASILMGISLFIKPIFAVLALLMILYPWKKGMLKRAIGIAIPLIPNAIMFLLNIPLLKAFLEVNFSMQNPHGLYRVNSVSFMNIFAMLDQQGVMFIIEGCLIAASCLFPVLLARKETTRDGKLLSVFAAGSFAILIFYQDVWPNQLFPIYTFVILYMIKNKNALIKKLVIANVAICLVKEFVFNVMFITGIIPQSLTNTPWGLVSTIVEPSILIALVVTTITTNLLTVSIYFALVKHENAGTIQV